MVVQWPCCVKNIILKNHCTTYNVMLLFFAPLNLYGSVLALGVSITRYKKKSLKNITIYICDIKAIGLAFTKLGDHANLKNTNLKNTIRYIL